MKEATDTFVAQMADGSERHVVKGQPFPDRHELVLRDADPKTGSGILFRDADYGADEGPAKSAPEAKAEAKAEPVKAEAKAAARGKAS